MSLSYSDKGLLTQLIDGAGDGDAKTFGFTYDAEQGNKNVKLVQVSDPRGNATNLTYFTAPIDPKDKWKLKTISDRLGDNTTFAYSDPDGSHEVKPNGNTVAYDCNLDGSVASQEETTTDGTLVARHALTYNANGHRVRDAAKLQNGDDSASYLDHVYEYGFDPAWRHAVFWSYRAE